MKTILVTGGAGYIGLHTCLELLKNDYDVIAIDNLCNNTRPDHAIIRKITGRDMQFITGDILDDKFLNALFSKYSIYAVLHFAGLKSAQESNIDPSRYYVNNVCAAITLQRCMEYHGVYRIAFSSSASVYGDNDKAPFCEDLPLLPRHPYGKSKRMVEEILADVQHAGPKWNVAILRYFNAVGAHKSGYIGEKSTGKYFNLMPLMVRVALGFEKELHIYGNDYNTRDGTCIRDYIHVMDLANAHVRVLDKLSGTNGTCIYNLGTGRGYTVLEMVESFERATGRKIPFQFRPRRTGDNAISIADPSRAHIELGWKTRYILNDMCADTWRWCNMKL